MLNLEQSARVLIGFSEGESFESNKYKSKIYLNFSVQYTLSILLYSRKFISILHFTW